MKEMGKPVNIPITNFDYQLPVERIAKYPLEVRDRSRLLVYENGSISSHVFGDAPSLLRKGDRLYFNVTRVVQARLVFRKETGGRIEIFILEPHAPEDHQLAFSSVGPVSFTCLVGNAKKWKHGTLRMEVGEITLEAKQLGRSDDKFVIQFAWDNADISFGEILEQGGSTPIPPYLDREAEEQDAATYQTVYARRDGSVAAPTAGLHFTDEVLGALDACGIERHELTLHVGAGTFIPVKEENAVDHAMHAELVTVDRQLLLSLLSGGRRIAVGTTSTRSLESVYWLGVKAASNAEFSFDNLSLDQWDAYELEQGRAPESKEHARVHEKDNAGVVEDPVRADENDEDGAMENAVRAPMAKMADSVPLENAIRALLQKMDVAGIDAFSFHTQLMITPGYRFRVIEGLFTNFHQPKSTLLLLIAAVAGDDWRRIYDYALEHEYRFLSYGDSSLLFLQQT